MVKLISVLVATLALAGVGCAEADERAPAPVAAPDVDAYDVEPQAFCTNSQCFDGDSGPPKGNGVDAWDWDHCVGACFLCQGICVPHCTQVGWCHP